MTTNEALTTIRRLGLPLYFENLVMGRGSASLLGIWADPTHCFTLVADIGRHVPELSCLCPLLEQNGEAVLGVLPQEGRYVRFYYEDGLLGSSAIETLGLNYQQFVMSLLLEVADAGLEQEFEALALLFEFASTAELRSLLGAQEYDEHAIDTLRRSL